MVIIDWREKLRAVRRDRFLSPKFFFKTYTKDLTNPGEFGNQSVHGAQTAQDTSQKILYPFMTSAKGDKGVSHGFTANFALRPRF